MSPYTALWLLWLGFFLAVEGQALLYRAPGATLTEHVVKWASIKTKGKWWRGRRFMLLAFTVWLAVHMLTGGGVF